MKLYDDNAKKRIEIDSSYKLNLRHYSLDTINNCFWIKRPIFRKIIVSSSNFETKTKRFYLFDKDSIQWIDLYPQSHYIQSQYRQLWFSETSVFDTIVLGDIDDLSHKIIEYLACLKAVNFGCDNGMCSYSNTYYYSISFKKENGVFEINNVKKVKPREYNCEPINDHLYKLKNIFPKIIFSDNIEEDDFDLYYYISTW